MIAKVYKKSNSMAEAANFSCRCVYIRGCIGSKPCVVKCQKVQEI